MHAPAIETPLPPSPGARSLYLKALDFSVLTQCIRCGICPPTCPTYAATKLERHSPRGRIQLMKNIAKTGVRCVANGNPSCSVQLEAGVRASGSHLEVAHPITLLARVYRATKHA